MAHQLGLHWIRVHPDSGDLAHIERMQYPSVKLFEWHWSDRDACAGLLAVLPKDAYILARDHPLSEQKEGVWHNPEAHGRSHADQWAEKVRRRQYHLPTDRTFFLGVNEPDATHGDRDAIDRYTEAYLVRLQAHGLRGGAFNFSTGHPRTVDGTPNTLVDYSVFERSHAAIVRGHHIAVAHIYGTAAVPCAPGHYDRLRACKWDNVPWVIGEFGIDEHVVGGGPHDGFHVPYAGRLEDYCAWLDTAILGIADPRIHSYQVFTFDFSRPWDSFDARAIREALESYTWVHAIPKPGGNGGSAYVPAVSNSQPSLPSTAPAGRLIWPVQGVVTQRWGENAAYYQEKLGIPYHNGLDIGAAAGAPVVAIADGVVAWVDNDAAGYGNYVRVWHPAYRFHSFVAHLSSAAVQRGQAVKQGDVIGTVGSTGMSTGPHAHLEIRLGTEAGYTSGTFGHSNGRVDPQTVYGVIGL